MKQAGVVAALVAEARTLRLASHRSDGLFVTRDQILVAVSGMGLNAAARAAGALVDAGAGALVSWGLAGGLAPTLCAGTICLPLEVISEEGARFETDPHWRALVDAAVGARGVVHGKLLSRAQSIDSLRDKAAAFAATSALAVDMESIAVAEAAARHGLPFIAVRVIVDTASDQLPPSVAAASSTGQVAVGALISALVRSPQDLPAVCRLALRYRKAMRALQAVGRSGALAPVAYSAAAVSRIA